MFAIMIQPSTVFSAFNMDQLGIEYLGKKKIALGSHEKGEKIAPIL